MKKNRPATKVSILCNESDLEKFIKILLLETSTFGGDIMHIIEKF